MRLDFAFYQLAYRSGRPAWDSSEPRPELTELVQGRPPGRALDLGCGTGTDTLYLASRGWDATGVDFAPEAIATARSRAAAARSAATFVPGDVTRLPEAGIDGDFDLVTDTGCYHGIPAARRDGYAAGVAALTRPGGDFYLAGVADPPVTWRLLGARGVDADDLHRRFGRDFDLVEERKAGPVGRSGRFVLYHLVRRQPHEPTRLRAAAVIRLSSRERRARRRRRNSIDAPSRLLEQHRCSIDVVFPGPAGRTSATRAPPAAGRPRTAHAVR